jgi:nucleotide-binding universal stress UspA family protein
MRLHSVLVPLDGSAFAEAALPLGISVARRAGARLRLVLVHSAVPWRGDTAAGIEVALQNQERDYLQATASRIDPAGSLVAETRLLQGAPGPALAAEVEAGGADLVVMATHGRGPLSRVWIGSVADYLVRHLHVPVLLVRPAEVPEVYGDTRLERVLVPLDSSSTSEQVLDAVLALGGPGVSITLVHVVEPVLGVAEPSLPFPMPMDPKLLGDLRAMAQARLDRVAGELRERGTTVVTRVLTGIGPAGMILEEAATGQHDLIGMTTHGEGGLRRLLLGSVADKVVRATTSPVLVVRPGGVL